MAEHAQRCLFLLGRDYHLGDLMWLTAVLRHYRRTRRTEHLAVCLPDRPISRILEHNPTIDELRYEDPRRARTTLTARYGAQPTVHDLRVLPLAAAMVRAWRRRHPWLYYRDLWCEARGQWLSTFLGLGALSDARPELRLQTEDRITGAMLDQPYVILAPHVGQFRLSVTSRLWSGIKGWPAEYWAALAVEMAASGYQPITLAASGQAPVPGTKSLLGLPIRQAAGVIERASVLVSGESGLWFVAAALHTPFLIVPWWLPDSITWPAAMNVPHRTLGRGEASLDRVLHEVLGLAADAGR